MSSAAADTLVDQQFEGIDKLLDLPVNYDIIGGDFNRFDVEGDLRRDAATHLAIRYADRSGVPKHHVTAQERGTAPPFQRTRARSCAT